MSIADEIVARANQRRDAMAARNARVRDAARDRAEADRDAAVERSARRLASHMLDVAAVKGSVEEDDLLLRGWPLGDLRRHGTRARDIANRVATRCA